jgi:hypothetical protein
MFGKHHFEALLDIAQNPRDLSPEVTLDDKGYAEEVRVRPASSVKTIKVVL